MDKAIQLQNNENENIYPINAKIIEDNIKGKARKYADGTLICSNTIKIINTAINTARGQVFGSAAITLPGYQQSFIANPEVTITLKSQDVSGTRLFWLSGGYSTGSNTAPPPIFLGCNQSTQAFPEAGYTINYIAIGRWK